MPFSAANIDRARARAERCFAVARSTTFAAERETAIARGTAIALEAGLNLDAFDIPGRARSSRARAPDRYEASDVREAMDRHRQHMAGWTVSAKTLAEAVERCRRSMEAAFRAAGARPGETVYDAQRRAFDDAVEAAKERDRARAAGRR